MDEACIFPATADDTWYEEFAQAVYSLGKSWPDILTDEQAEWCSMVADKYAPRPDDEKWDL